MTTDNTTPSMNDDPQPHTDNDIIRSLALLWEELAATFADEKNPVHPASRDILNAAAHDLRRLFPVAFEHERLPGIRTKVAALKVTSDARFSQLGIKMVPEPEDLTPEGGYMTIAQLLAQEEPVTRGKPPEGDAAKELMSKVAPKPQITMVAPPT